MRHRYTVHTAFTEHVKNGVVNSLTSTIHKIWTKCIARRTATFKGAILISTCVSTATIIVSTFINIYWLTYTSVTSNDMLVITYHCMSSYRLPSYIHFYRSRRDYLTEHYSPDHSHSLHMERQLNGCKQDRDLAICLILLWCHYSMKYTYVCRSFHHPPAQNHHYSYRWNCHQHCYTCDCSQHYHPHIHSHLNTQTENSTSWGLH